MSFPYKNSQTQAVKQTAWVKAKVTSICEDLEP